MIQREVCGFRDWLLFVWCYDIHTCSACVCAWSKTDIHVVHTVPVNLSRVIAVSYKILQATIMLLEVWGSLLFLTQLVQLWSCQQVFTVSVMVVESGGLTVCTLLPFSLSISTHLQVPSGQPPRVPPPCQRASLLSSVWRLCGVLGETHPFSISYLLHVCTHQRSGTVCEWYCSRVLARIKLKRGDGSKHSCGLTQSLYHIKEKLP